MKLFAKKFHKKNKKDTEEIPTIVANKNNVLHDLKHLEARFSKENYKVTKIAILNCQTNEDVYRHQLNLVMDYKNGTLQELYDIIHLITHQSFLNTESDIKQCQTIQQVDQCRANCIVGKMFGFF